MRFRTPIEGQDYGPGFAGFSRPREAGHYPISDVIVWFGTLQEACDFSASHEFTVCGRGYVSDRVFYPDPNGRWIGVEAAEKGTEYFDLADRLADTELEFVFREPVILNEQTVQEILDEAARLVKENTPYDYTGLVLGHPIASIGLARWIKPLRKLPVLFHWPGALVCSNLGAKLLKATKAFMNFILFREWHITRITPVLLYNRGPFKAFRFDKE